MSDLVPWMIPWGGRLLTLASMLLGLFVCGYALFIHGRSRGRPRCPKCWYDLSGLTNDRCPECGRDVRSPRDRFRTRRAWKTACVGLLLSAALPAYVAHRRVSVYGWRYYTYVGPVYWLWPERVRETFVLGEHTVEIWEDRQPLGVEPEHVRIRRGGNPIFEREAWRWHIGVSDRMPKVTDLNGNGKSEVVLEEWDGGAHNIGPTHFVELDGDAAVVIDSLERGGWLTDDDKNGVHEVHVLDQQFNYWHSSYAGSPMAHVELRWQGGRLVPDTERMRRAPLPSEAELSELAVELRESLLRDLTPQGIEDHSALWGTMIDLIYAGQADRAYRFLDEAWPGVRPGKGEFVQEFRERLASSRFADWLVEMGHPRFDAPTTRPDAGPPARPPGEWDQSMFE